MPHVQQKSQNLQLAGPLLEVIITPPQIVIEKLREEGLQVPRQKTMALIDTGASSTCIDKTVAEALRLVSHDIVRVHTAGGDDMQYLYDIGIILPLGDKSVFSVQVFEAKLNRQPFKVLLGRDVLKSCTLIYNGWDDSYTLHL